MLNLHKKMCHAQLTIRKLEYNILFIDEIEQRIITL